MDLITEIVRKNLILEKRIAQLITKMEVIFNIEFHKDAHADSRSTRPEQGQEYNQRKIVNRYVMEGK